MARGGEGEHEASRRMKTELLMQMDGLASTQSDGKFVFVLTASNLPWELDSAMLRRLEKRIYVGLPEREARQTIIDGALREFKVEAEADCGGHGRLLWIRPVPAVQRVRDEVRAPSFGHRGTKCTLAHANNSSPCFLPFP